MCNVIPKKTSHKKNEKKKTLKNLLQLILIYNQT